MARNQMTLSTVHWTKYLNTKNERSLNFLQKNGKYVLWQIVENLHKCFGFNPKKEFKNQLVMYIHPNTAHAIEIPKKDFYKAFKFCLDWFESVEDYETCSKIVKLMEESKKAENKSSTKGIKVEKTNKII